jgi:hypothetical protein
MAKHSLTLWLTFTAVFAALGNYSYFYMQAKLKKLIAFQPKLLKYPTDIREVYLRYRALALTERVPRWPAKIFVLSLIIIALSVLYLLLPPKPFG